MEMTIQTLVFWMLGTAGTLVGSGVVAYVAVVQRITRLEASWELLGIKAAKILHSPDDHHQIDGLLEKYVDRHYELTFDEWRRLMEVCAEIENNKELPKGERILAAFLGAVSHHKLRLPPPEKFLPR